MKHPVATLIIALLSGVVFGIGLGIAQMTNPQKIKDFLDITAIPGGGWDPSLIFVMGGGLIVAFFGLRLDKIIHKPLFGLVFSRSSLTKIDTQLMIGAAIFGVGWGISGFCPGPAIADLSLAFESAALFVAALLAGSWITGEIVSGRPVAEPAE